MLAILTIISIYLLNFLGGLFAIIYGSLAFCGLLFNIRYLNNLYYTGWMKNEKPYNILLLYYAVCSTLLIVLGCILIFLEVEITSPFKY